MSLEAKIEDLTAAIHALVAAMSKRNDAPAAAPVAAPVAPVAVAPVAAPVPTPPAPVTEPPAMPAPPVFAVPAPVAAPAASAPFSDPKGLIGYVMEAYKNLGPAKGAQIQQVLVSLGYQNINDVKAEHYGALFAGVEALKG